VAELSHDTADDGFHEIQLSGKQLVFLFMATTVVSVVIFLCGVLVGRGVHPPSSDPMQVSAASRSATSPATAPASAGQPSTQPPATQPPGAQPPAPQPAASAPAEPPPTPPEGELTYKKRLESEGTVAEDRLKSGASQKSANPRATPKAAPAETTGSATATTSAARPGKFVVQIVALKDRSSASSLVQRLTAKGYPAFLVNPAAGAPAPVYKVQVGRFEDRRAAEQVKRRLEKEEKFKPWISP
jgi:DedD protein